MSATTPPLCFNCYQPVRRCENATFIGQQGCLHGQYVHMKGNHFCGGKPSPGLPFDAAPFACRGTPGRHRRDRTTGKRVVWSTWHLGWVRLGIWRNDVEMFI